MTRDEFDEQRATLACRHCGVVGLVAYRPSNGDMVGAMCPGCESKAPLAGVQWLPKDSARARRPKMAATPDEVWTLNGGHCSFCGKPDWLCKRLGIGRTMQHVLPAVFGEGSGPLIPFCARCQEASAAALKETRNVLGEIDTLDTIIKRIESRHPELRS